MNVHYRSSQLRIVRDDIDTESGKHLQSVPASSDERAEEPPARISDSPRSSAARVAWSVRVNARDAFMLCRVLTASDEVDIKSCTPVVKQGETGIRVDVTLPADCVDSALHNVMQYLDNAEFGRIQ